MSSTRRQLLTLYGAVMPAVSVPWLISCSRKSPSQTSIKEEATWAESVANLCKRIPQLMSELRVPGTSISIIRNGRISWRKNFGVKDQISGDPVDDDTIFEAQSMSKPVFAYRVLKLAEQGVLDLDAPLTRYTQDRFVQGDSRLELITARRVLSHTTGLPTGAVEKNH